MKKLALFGGERTKTKPFHPWPYSNNMEQRLILEVLDSGKWWRMTGEKVEEFEKSFAAMQGVKFCLGVTNGTHALELALTTLGIGSGDEVIVPAVTFVSTGSAVICANATPVLVDVDLETYCMQPEAFEQAITSKTKAVIPVHMAGHACEMEKICKIANKYGIKVIEDAAHAHGGECNGKMLGSFGDMAIFSFQNGKLMTCGEGGALVTSNEELYKQAYLFHGVGRPKNDQVYEHTVLGSNYRMNEFSAAILLAQQTRLKTMNEKRDINAKHLDSLLATIPGIYPQARKKYATCITHYMYMFFYDSTAFNNLSRSQFIEYLNAEGIPAFRCFPVLSETTFFKNNAFNRRIDGFIQKKENSIDNATKIANNVVWLPHYTLLGDEEDLSEIYFAIKKIQDTVNSIGRTHNDKNGNL